MNNNYAIDVININKSFGKQHVVKDLSLQVASGEIFGFLGPNGSGKTTSIRMLCGLLTPDSGTGYCLGYDILKQSAQIKHQTGYMTQNFSMWNDLTVYENLNFVAQVYAIPNRNQVIGNIIEQFNLSKFKTQLAGSLSGGWKQRLALAACMLHKPKLLLLDEPTAGIDPKARRDFWEELHTLASQGISILVSTHYMDEAERCNKLAYIFNGKLITTGSAHEIISQHQIFTYSISGKNLSELSLQLKQSKGVTQSISFGDSLHVSGIEQQPLQDTIDKLKTNKNYEIKQIQTSLEDVFVYLMANQTDNFRE